MVIYGSEKLYQTYLSYCKQDSSFNFTCWAGWSQDSITFPTTCITIVCLN